jgi:hypothetical protein
VSSDIIIILYSIDIDTRMALTVKFTNGRDYIAIGRYVSQTKTTSDIRRELQRSIDTLEWRNVDRAHSMDVLAREFVSDTQFDIVYDGAPGMCAEIDDIEIDDTFSCACDSMGCLVGWVLRGSGSGYRIVSPDLFGWDLVDLWSVYFDRVQKYIDILEPVLQWAEEARGRDIDQATVMDTLGREVVGVRVIACGGGFRIECPSITIIWSGQSLSVTEIYVIDAMPALVLSLSSKSITIYPIQHTIRSFSLHAAVECCSGYDTSAVNQYFAGLLDACFNGTLK